MATKLLGNQSRGLVFVVSAPAGTGKTTLVRMLANEFSCVVESISVTTRSPRPGEIEGIDYHFVSKSVFEEKIAAEEFLEYAEVFGNYYGTSKKEVEVQQQQGKHLFLVIDTQGALQIMGKIKAVFIFILPPSIDELQRRLAGRQTDAPEVIKKRLSCAAQEIEAASHYDYHIVNDDLSTAYHALRSIAIAEEHKVQKSAGS